jgi:CRISPR-associated protein Csb2
VNRPDPAWNLLAESADVQAARLEVPPGARWQAYDLLATALTPEPARSSLPTIARNQPTVARFLLDGPVLPLVTDTVRVAEALRSAAMSRFNAWCHRQQAAEVEQFRRTDRPDRYSSPVLAGKDTRTRGPYLPGHDHAHFLPTAEGDDCRRLTHVTVYARQGFGAGETAALTGLRRVQVGDLELHAQLVGLGQPCDFRAELFGGPSGPEQVWVSVTPYVGPAHVRKVGRNRYMRRAIRTEWRRWRPRELADVEVQTVEVIADTDSAWAGRPRPFEFVRGRARPGDDGYGRPFGLFKITFEAPIQGPLCLGYACHYGLGLFLPVPAVEQAER